MKTRPISDLRREQPAPPRIAEAQKRAERFNDLLRYLLLQGEPRTTIVLPLPPALLNGSLSRAHWSTIRAAKHQYESQCRVLRMARLLPPVPAVPWPQVLVRATFYTVRAYDADNLVSLMKMTCDFLKGSYFVDDAPHCMTLGSVTQERCGQSPRRVEIELQQVLGGDT